MARTYGEDGNQILSRISGNAQDQMKLLEYDQLENRNFMVVLGKKKSLHRIWRCNNYKRKGNIYIAIKESKEMIYTNQTVQFPVTSTVRNIDGNHIAVELIKSCHEQQSI